MDLIVTLRLVTTTLTPPLVGDLQGLLTVVEAPGKPLSADLSLSRSAKRSNNAN